MIRKHIKELDTLRCIAAILVLLYHYTTQYDNSFGHLGNYPVNISWGYMGVSVFFLLSGFLTVMNLRENETLGSFILRRAIKLYPVYWVSIILTTIVMFMILPEKLRTFETIIVNFTMLQDFLGFKAVDGVYWTLTIEIMFYAFIGTLLYFNCIRNIMTISSIWLILSIIFSVVKLFINNIFVKLLSFLLITTYSHMFIAGIMLCKLYKNPKQIVPHIIICLCFINQVINQGLEYTIFFILVTSFVYLIIYRVISFSIPCFEFIARISYPLYLTHQFIGFGLIHEIFLLIPISISIGLAYLLYKYIEQPSAQFFKTKNILKN